MSQLYPVSLANPVASPSGRDEWEPRRIGALVALLLGAFFAVIVFLPPEGRVAVPVHAALDRLLGRASFMVPVGLAFVGLVLIVSALRPNAAVPWRRLVGVGLLALSVPPSEHLLDDGTGLVGSWLSSTLLDVLGSPGTLLVLGIGLGLGVWLAFDLRLSIVRRPVDAAG